MKPLFMFHFYTSVFGLTLNALALYPRGSIVKTNPWPQYFFKFMLSDIFTLNYEGFENATLSLALTWEDKSYFWE